MGNVYSLYRVKNCHDSRAHSYEWHGPSHDLSNLDWYGCDVGSWSVLYLGQATIVDSVVGSMSCLEEKSFWI
jgi:hypothetical protein